MDFDRSAAPNSRDLVLICGPAAVGAKAAVDGVSGFLHQLKTTK